MKGPRRQYPKVNQLPPEAMSITNYAKSQGIQVGSVYGRYDAGAIKIVGFQGYNFVLAAAVDKVVKAPIKIKPAVARSFNKQMESNYLKQRRQAKLGVKK